MKSIDELAIWQARRRLCVVGDANETGSYPTLRHDCRCMNGTFAYEEELVQVNSRATARYESELTDTYLFPDWFSPPEYAVRGADPGSQRIFAALRR